MKRIALSILFAAACSTPQTSSSGSGSAPQPTPPPETQEAPQPAPTPAVMTPDECKAAGGTVKNDIGDGQVKCADTEREIGKVRFGMEGGVCCAAP